jgi:hypothetical protein
MAGFIAVTCTAGKNSRVMLDARNMLEKERKGRGNERVIFRNCFLAGQVDKISVTGFLLVHAGGAGPGPPYNMGNQIRNPVTA